MHSGIAFAGDDLVVAHPGRPELLFVARDGSVRRTLPLTGVLEPHGFRVVPDGIWIGDVGFKRRVHGGEFETDRETGRVVLVGDGGAIVHELHDPGAGWSPTA